MSVYHVSNFIGGMNEVVSPLLISENQAKQLIDADVQSGKIKSVKAPLKLDYNSPSDLLHYGNRNRSVVKWYDRYYWSDNVKMTYGGNIENLGIPFPSALPSVEKEISPSGLTGIYKYAITFVNKNGWESAPGLSGNYYTEVELQGQFARLGLPEKPEGIAYIKIYRTMENGADFYCVGETEESEFFDTMDDITASMQNVLDTFEDFPPPSGGKYLTEAGGVFFLAVGSNLYFSKLSNPHAWSPLNFLGVDDTITGISPEFQGVLVFTGNNTYRIVGADDAATITKNIIPGNQGCINNRTISQLANFPVWLSNDGICIWDGSNIAIVSMRIMNTYRLSVKCAVSANDVYYLFTDDGAICFDHRNDGIFYKLSTTCDYAWYDGNTDNLYLQKSDGIYLFGGGETQNYLYVSPDIGGNDLTYKKIQEIIVSAEGPFNITVTADNRSICSIAVKNSGRHRIKMPYSTTARTLNLKIVGSVGLNEISVLYN